MNTRILPDWIPSYLEYTHNTEPPTIYNHWCAISTICAVLRRKCFFRWEKMRYPNMYILLVGPAGRCRKGTAMYPAIELLRRLSIPLAAERTTAESLILEIYNNLAVTQDPRDPTINYSHCSLTLTSPEFSVFLGFNNPAFMMDLVDFFDCADVWIYRTKNSGEQEINNLYLNILGATTPELIQLTMPQDAVGAGLTSRMIFVYADKISKRVHVPIKTQKEKLLFEDLYHDLEIISKMAGEFKLAEDFIDVWVPFYDNHQDNSEKGMIDGIKFPPQLLPYIERRPRHIQVMAMCYSASRSSDMIITGQDLADAVQYCTYTEKRMPGAFTGYGRHKDAAVVSMILGHLCALGKGGSISKTEFFERYAGEMELLKLQGMLAHLEKEKIISTFISPDGNKIIYNGGLDHTKYGLPPNAEPDPLT